MTIKTCIADLIEVINESRLPKDYLSEHVNEAFVAEWKSLAEAGNADAQYLYGQCLLDGIFVEQDQRSGLDLIANASEQGHALSHYRVSICFMNGIVVEQNFKNALKFARFAGEQGLSMGWHTVGFLYEHVYKDLEQAFQFYQQAAHAGIACSITSVGHYFYHGHGGVERDLMRALGFYQEAAKKGDVQAMNNVACFCAQGLGTEQDDELASEWGLKAAEKGMPEAQLMMGKRLCTGTGISKDTKKGIEMFRAAKNGGSQEAFNLLLKMEDADTLHEMASVCHQDNDLERAILYYERAAKQGHPISQYNLAWCLGTGQGIAQDEARSVALYEASARNGFAPAQYEIGAHYLAGKGVSKDQNTAMEWFRQAANQGNIDAIRAMANMGIAQAQYHLASLYHQGNGVEKNIEQAERYYRKAAEQGLAEAQFNLVWCMRYGGKEHSLAEIVYWLTKASEQGVGLAQYELAMCYLKGDGVEQDKKRADYWLNQAAEQGHPDAMILSGNASGSDKENEFMKNIQRS